MKKNKLNIVLDIDDVIFQWQEAYASRFNTHVPKAWSNSNLMKRRLSSLMLDKNFWLTLPIKNIPNFQPKGFLSARSVPKTWTIESLKINNIPGRSNVNQVKWGESKIESLRRLEADIFIDDKVETFKECHNNGIFCLLMTANHNQKFNTKYRIDNLNYENILNLYQNR